MRIHKLLQKIKSGGQKEAIVWKGNSYTFDDLGKKIYSYQKELSYKGIKSGQIIGIQSDYSVESIALLLALWSNRNIVAFIPNGGMNEKELLFDAQIEQVIRIDQEGLLKWEIKEAKVDHPLLLSLKKSHSSGFIIFSSGSTGKPKAILHDVERFLCKFDSARKRFRTLAFLLFDHIAGIDTLLYVLSSNGVLIIPERRETAYICQLIEEQCVEVLPTSPTFLNLLCLSRQFKMYDISSLRVITYGSEPMNKSVLRRVRELFPNVKIIQKYGLSELGSPHSQSKEDDSLWIKINDDKCQTKIVDNILWVKSKSAMVGYLNAPERIDKNGWFSTGDEVMVDGEWMKVLGRKSDVIIVGGEKVYPAEIETILTEIPNILDATVMGEQHNLFGQIVTAKVQLGVPGNEKSVFKEIRQYCKGKLEPYKIPVKIEVMDKLETSARHKKCR